MEYFYLLDLIGTFAFSVYGAYIGLKKNFDYVGVTLCAFLCAMGGGTIREVILNRVPFYFHDYNYIYVMLAGVAFCTITYSYFHKINKAMLVLDAVGLSTFAFIGAATAIGADLGIVGAIIFAVITAVGGGILRDMVANRTPSSFLERDFYAGPVVLSAVLQYLYRDFMHDAIAVFSLLCFIFIVRVAAIFLNIDFRKWHNVFGWGKVYTAKAFSAATKFFF